MMKQSKKGFGLAEVIVSFVLMIMLIGVMAMAIRFSQTLMLQAASMRDRTNEIALAFAGDPDRFEPSSAPVATELEFLSINSDDPLSFIIPIKIVELEYKIELSETETLTFRVFAEP